MGRNNTLKTESTKEPETFQVHLGGNAKKGNVIDFFKRWWLIILLLILFCWAIKARFIIPNAVEYDLVMAMINVMAILAIIFYVIYTRDLANSSIQIARANMILAQSTFSTVEAVIEPKDIDIAAIDKDCLELSRIINVEDGELSAGEFEAALKKEKARTLCLKIHCMGVRSVYVTKVSFEVRYFGCKEGHEQVLELKDVCKVDPNAPDYINLVLSPKGFVCLQVVSVDFSDGFIARTRKLNKYFEDKLPETSGGIE